MGLGVWDLGIWGWGWALNGRVEVDTVWPLGGLEIQVGVWRLELGG